MFTIETESAFSPMSRFNQQIEKLLARNEAGMIRGRYRRRQALLRWQATATSGATVPRDFNRLCSQIEESAVQRERRADRVPIVRLDEELPIASAAEEIERAIHANPVVVVTGETGSGKSTQLPLILLRAGFGIDGYIGHTQPRRIAARGVAQRLAQQLDSPLGRFAGYKVRFADHFAADAYIKLMTDGILLAETQSDRTLGHYRALIIDEAHERSLNIDFILGYLKRLLPQRPDLKVVITSATIDAQRFADHFSAEQRRVPVIAVSGRSFAVDIRYQPIDSPGQADDSVDSAVHAVLELLAEGAGGGAGDILVFLPTEFDIRSAARQLRGALSSRGGGQTEILPLYARLTLEQQNLVFAPHRARRIVLATNVAESSLTVPGIRYVVDSGTARISRYAPRSKVQRLPIEAISKASADQRAGRCGRVGPGVCVRLFSRDDYEQRAPYTTPEIRRTNLASAILQTKALGLGEIDQFPFLDPPSREAVRDGFETLFEIQALDHEKNLTDIGRMLSRLPTDPRIGRVLLAAHEFDCLNEVAIIAAGLEIPDPRLRPFEQAAQADERHRQWSDGRSDFMSLLALFDFHQRLKAELSRSRLTRACQQHFLSPHHLREWVDVHRQLLAMTEELGWRTGPRRDDYDAIHRALLSGFLSGVALRQDRNLYQGAGGIQWQAWPGSGLADHPPQWVVAGELVETGKRYGRTLAKIQPQWIESLAHHLLLYEYEEPHWNEQRQSCLAWERGSLWGLPVIGKRLVPYAPIDPQHARNVMIDAGLVGGAIPPRFPFQVANQRLRDQLAGWASKTRDRQFVVDDWTIHRFYAERLPPEAVDAAALQRLIAESPELNAKLRMTSGDLIPGIRQPKPEEYPDQFDAGGMCLNLRYRYEPGAVDDGVNLDVPRPAVAQLTEQQLEWLVPGRLADKVAELIRTLPKEIRRRFVPVPETANRVLERLQFGRGRLLDAVAKQLSALAEAPVQPADFRLERLPAHVQINVRAIDDSGRVIAQGRDLPELRRELQIHGVAATTVAPEGGQWNRSGLTTWSFHDLPENIVVRRGGVEVRLFPMLKDEGASVTLGLSETAEVARWQSRLGCARLFQLAHHKAIQSHLKWLPDLTLLTAAVQPWVSGESLMDRLGGLLSRIAFVESQPELRTEGEYHARAADAARRLAEGAHLLGSWVRDVARELHGVRLRLESDGAHRNAAIRGDVVSQLDEYFGFDFPNAVPWTWLLQYPRYLSACALRLDKAGANAARDSQAAAEIQRQWSRFQKQRERHSPPYPVNDRLTEIRWLIEELRVSLFAQQLGTKVPISVKRLDKVWSEVDPSDRAS